ILHIFIDGFIREGDIESALQMIDLMRQSRIKVERNIFLKLIECCTKMQNLQKALHILEIMKMENISPTPLVYDLIIGMCVKTNKNDMAIKFFEEMQKNGIQPKSSTIPKMIRVYHKMNKIDKAIQIFEKSKKGKPDIRIYNAILEAFVREEMWKEIEPLLEEMRNSKIRFTEFTFSQLITA